MALHPPARWTDTVDSVLSDRHRWTITLSPGQSSTQPPPSSGVDRCPEDDAGEAWSAVSRGGCSSEDLRSSLLMTDIDACATESADDVTSAV